MVDRVLKSFRDHVGGISPTRSPVNSPVHIGSQSRAPLSNALSNSINGNGVTIDKPSTLSAEAEIESLRKQVESYRLKHQLLLQSKSEMEDKFEELQDKYFKLKDYAESLTAKLAEHKCSNPIPSIPVPSTISIASASLVPELSRLEVDEEVRGASSPIVIGPAALNGNGMGVGGKKNMICRHYLKGRCRYKSNCKFSHDVKQCPECGYDVSVIPKDQVMVHLANCWSTWHPNEDD